MRHPKLGAALPLILAVGCESIDSTTVGTDSIYADFAATSDGSQTHTTAVLRVGGATSNTFVNLEGDDVLRVTSGDQTQEMTESYVGDVYVYSADFDLVEADTPFTFSLERSVDAGAPDSTCTLPEPLDVTSPEPDSVFSRSADDLTVSWEPSGEQDPVRIIVQGDCIWRTEIDVDGDPGTTVIAAGTIESISEDDPQACDATLTIQRRRSGDLDPGFGQGGTIFGIQERTIGFRTDP
ncbi:MAG: hypothetical protein D6798_06010 [Deltaproteobacteria bacterium]|nr:MAG: hypothetical protein D6798_06010 [Deltaproteobacteria bacterium]